MDLCEFTEDIIIEILSRIPAKDLVIFKTVCKLWYKLISDSNFVSVHLSRSKRQIILKTYDLGYWGIDKYLSMRIDCKNMMTTVVEKLNLNNLIPKAETVSILAGCNGLLLLQNYSSCKFFYYVCNLAIRQCTILPHPMEPLLNHTVPFRIKCGWAMFYDTFVEKFGVFAIWEKHVIMLTSGDKQWKYYIFPKHDAYCHLTLPVFEQRKLHWIACPMYGHDKFICSLDVGNMGFKMIKLPTSEAKWNFIFLSSENKESLCVATVFQDHLDVWGLADKSNNPSWTKKTSITLQSLSNIPNFWVGMCIVGIKEDDDSNDDIALKLIVFHGDKLLYHDLKSRELKQIANIHEGFQVTRPGQFHVDSLVSWHPTKAMGKYKLTATKDCNQLIANDYIELRNKRKIPMSVIVSRDGN